MFRSKRQIIIYLLIVTISMTGSLSAQEALNKHLEPFSPYINKTWRGEFKNSGDDKMTRDVSRWERALNGQAIRILHSVNDGEYGGETIIFYDAKKESIVFYYFTTAGFYTTGTCTFEDGKIISYEEVTGNQDGITKVKATGEILPDGKLRSKSQLFQNGKWVDGHKIIYTEDPKAKVIFK